MHYEVKYEETNDVDKLSKAINDIREYLGETKFNKLTNDARKNIANGCKVSRQYWHFIVSIVGIQGFPCDAWYIYCFGLQAYCDAIQNEKTEN